MKINSLADLNRTNLPLVVIRDVTKRISDWLESGGTTQDSYVRKQFQYAERVLNRK